MESPEHEHKEALSLVLEKILASGDFDAPERNRNFLSYVVMETLEGRSAWIKAYSIAITVFGRPENFDPMLDSIVRIEAGRLRRSLERYYLTAGREDSVRISIPKGTYVPVFEDVSGEATAKTQMRGVPQSTGPSILVMPFEQEGDHSSFPYFAKAFIRHLIMGMTRFTDLRVFGQETSNAYSGLNPTEAAERLDVDFVLYGVATQYSDRFCIEAFLKDMHTHQILWANVYDRPRSARNVMVLRDEAADEIVRALAQPYGIIFSKRAKEVDGQPPECLEAYDCVVRFHQYWRTFDPASHEPVRLCLEAAIERNPYYAEAFACLSQVHTNDFRYRYSSTDGDACLHEALKLARRAIELAPNSSQGHYALGLAYWFFGDLTSSFEAYETGLRLNPNDTKLSGELGFRYAMRMEWDKAIPLITESYVRNPAQAGTYRMGLALYHYHEGSFEKAIAEARKVDATGVVYQHLVTAAAAYRLGRRAEVEEAIASILELDPRYPEVIVSDLEDRNLHPDLIEAIVRDARDAGLKTPDMNKRLLQG